MSLLSLAREICPSPSFLTQVSLGLSLLSSVIKGQSATNQVSMTTHKVALIIDQTARKNLVMMNMGHFFYKWLTLLQLNKGLSYKDCCSRKRRLLLMSQKVLVQQLFVASLTIP